MPGKAFASSRDGRINHISRDVVSLRDTLGPVTSLNWAWVCSVLANSKKLELDVLDTVLFKNSSPTVWFFTGRTGKVCRRTGRLCSSKKILSTFCPQKGTATQGVEVATVVAHDVKGGVSLLTHTELGELFERSRVGKLQIHDVLCLQRCVVSGKGSRGSSFAHYHGQYTVDNQSRQKYSAFIINTVEHSKFKPMLAGKPQRLVPCRTPPVTNSIKRIVAVLVNAVEALEKCKVLSLKADFTTDGKERTWLVRVSVVEIAKPRVQAAQRSTRPVYSTPSNMAQRNAHNTGRAQASLAAKNAELLLEIGLTGGEGVHQIAETALGTSNGYLGTGSSGTLPPSVARCKARKPNEDALQRDQAENSDALRFLGLCKGCPGQFCKVEFELESDQQRVPGASIAHMGEHFISLQSSRQNAGIGTASVKAEAKNDEGLQYKVTYKTVLLARQEKYLVDLLLRRIQRKEKQEYVRKADHLEPCILGTLHPEEAYREIDVCANCNKIYAKIEQARRQATHKAEKIHVIEDTDCPLTYEKKLEELLAQGASAAENGKAPTALGAHAQEVARYAQKALTRTEIAELASLSNPPALVKLVCEALMFLLEGKTLPWEDCRSRLSCTEKVLVLIREYECSQTSDKTLNQLEEYFINPDFRPTLVSAVCKAAASICRWVLAVLLANRFEAAAYHPRADPLGTDTVMNASQHTSSHEEDSREEITLPLPTYLLKRVPRKQQQKSCSNTTPLSSYKGMSESHVESKQQENMLQRFKQQEKMLPEATEEEAKLSQQYSLIAQAEHLEQTQVAGSPPSTEPTAESSESKVSKADEFSNKLLEKCLSVSNGDDVMTPSQEIRARLQRAQMKRLAGTVDESSGEEGGTEAFLCSDGKTEIPFMVSGVGTAAKRCLNLVVCNDLFDTFESIQILIDPILRKHPGSKALYFNYPGQAYTESQSLQGRSTVVNNEGVAKWLHELLQHTEKQGSFITSSLPFYLVGFGNGVNILACFALDYGNLGFYKSGLQGLLSVNGFLGLDSQLTSILHSTIKVFSCFPPTRPDLPVSYFARFLFSEEYLKRVNPNLVLNLYTAVANPITVDGRIRICKGALRHKDVASRVSSLNIPLIVVQSTENLLVSPANVDPFLKGRNVTHLWSHQFANGKLTESAVEEVSKGVYQPNSACVLWIKAGHEMKQEARPSLVEVLDILLKSSPKPIAEPNANVRAHSSKAKIEEAKTPRRVELIEKGELKESSFREAIEQHKAFKKTAADSRLQRAKDIEEIEKRLRESDARISVPYQKTLSSVRAPESKDDEIPRVSDSCEGISTLTSPSPALELDEEVEKVFTAKWSESDESRGSKIPQQTSTLGQSQAEVNEAISQVLCSILQRLEGEVEQPIDAKILPEDGVLPETEFDAIRSGLLAGVSSNLQDSPRDVDEEELTDAERSVEAIKIQKLFRGKQGRFRCEERREELRVLRAKTELALKVQSLERARQARIEFRRREDIARRDRLEGEAAKSVQRVFRGHCGRRKATRVRTIQAGKTITRVARGTLSRKRVRGIIAEKERIALENWSATRIQATWRMHASKSKLLHQRILNLAAIQVQRVYRGVRGRRRTERKRRWENAEPGAERLKLGIQLIDESKKAFKSQQEEIDSLHRAQEKAERRVGEIYAGLKESESELVNLEQELLSIDELDKSLFELSTEKSLLKTLEEPGTSSKGGTGKTSPKNDMGEVHALEMEIHLKRADRERKKKQLEVEFAVAFDEVKEKRAALETLEGTIQDIESTRNRKEREFQRLQRNLMELLEDQKSELENLREKGVELEVATSSSAAAAAATLNAARENETKSKEMFNSTEELLKFQFMSMSLSYFSSMNMIKSLRDINADTTQKAISSTAATAATAAAVASAANIPANKTVPSSEAKSAVPGSNTQEVLEKLTKEKYKPLPESVRSWTVEDVGLWLDSLSLSQYKSAFNEASIDGDFLLELRPEDMRDVLGMSHPLHVQKVVVSREKVRPLNEAEMRQKKAVLFEQSLETEYQEEQHVIPDVGTVFSQIRNSRYKKVEEALDLGFDPNSLDSNGNTALIVAAQNTNKRIAELLLNRGAEINHQNSQGNTPMHYAMAYDPQGTLGEFFIGRGADDTLENQLGLSPYDGIE